MKQKDNQYNNSVNQDLSDTESEKPIENAFLVTVPFSHDHQTNTYPKDKDVPIVRSVDEILNEYSNNGWSTEELKSIPIAEEVGSDDFYNENELRVLQAQPIPEAYDYSKHYNDEGPAESKNENPVILLESKDGSLPIYSTPYSPARFSYESIKSGIVSRDPILNNREAIAQFMNVHGCSRPRYYIRVVGSHTVSEYDSTTDSYKTRRSEDFSYYVDLTRFVFPFGKVSSSDGTPVETLIDNYLNDTSRLKSLQLQKRVNFNYRALIHLMRAYIRKLGWRNDLDLHLKIYDKSVRVAANNTMARCYDNACIRVLMVITIIPAIACCCMARKHRNRDLRSTFCIPYDAIQIFECIRPFLFVPSRFRNCNLQ